MRVLARPRHARRGLLRARGGLLAALVLLEAAAAPAALAAPPRGRGPASAPASRPAARLEDSLAALRRQGYGAAAQALAARVAQRGPKMKLSHAAAGAAAAALLRRLPSMPSARALHAVMPRSLVELIRAVEERGVPPVDAEALAAYLLRFTRTLRFANLAQLDENHSHVIGRRWPEIDYTGEGTTWQARRDHWSRLGVDDFRTAAHVHRYFVAESKLGYFRRIYRPRGRMADVAAP
jgi:hypothetical protein